MRWVIQVMIKTPTTKIIKYGKQIEKYLDIIHKLDKELCEVENNELNNLLEDMEGWRDCIGEIELKVKSVMDKEIITSYEYDTNNNETIIY